MITVLSVTQIIISLLLIAIVLVQNKNVSLNLTSMGGGMGPVTKRGGEKVLHNATIVLGILFALNSLLFFFIR